jgi:hypothetical protein
MLTAIARRVLPAVRLTTVSQPMSIRSFRRSFAVCTLHPTMWAIVLAVAKHPRPFSP